MVRLIGDELTSSVQVYWNEPKRKLINNALIEGVNFTTP
jgi:hypothetical protein